MGQLDELKLLCFHTQLRVAQDAGAKRLFINVDLNFLERMSPFRTPTGMDIIMEISETEALKDVDHYLGIAKQWRELGFKFAIDDFGAGFISLPFIAQLIPDYIKLDISIIQQMTACNQFKKFITNLVSILKQYSGTGIIAEGIEDARQLQEVKNAGIQYVQGFLLSKPDILERLQ